MSAEKKMVKKSLSSQKSSPSVMGPPDFFRDKMTIPADVKKDCEAKGLDVRWVNYNKYINEGGHDKGWEVYRRPKGGEGSTLFGSHPDGIVKHGDSLIAVRPKEMSARHKAWINYQNERLSNPRKAAAAQFKEKAREVGVYAEERDYFEEDGAGE